VLGVPVMPLFRPRRLDSEIRPERIGADDRRDYRRRGPARPLKAM
jgi:hypothetical protein